MANSVDPDQTARSYEQSDPDLHCPRSSLIRVYTVCARSSLISVYTGCPDLSVQKLKIIMVHRKLEKQTGRMQTWAIFHKTWLGTDLSCLMTEPTKWLLPAKTQICLGICPVWSESSLSTWRKLRSLATLVAHSRDADQTGWMPRLIWVFAGRSILSVLSWGGSFGKHFPEILQCFNHNKMVAHCMKYSIVQYEPPHDKTNKMTLRPVETQIRLCIRPVWSDSSLAAWRKLGSLATHWAHSKDSDQSRRMPRLIWVFTGRSCRFAGFVMRRLIWKYLTMQ